MPNVFVFAGAGTGKTERIVTEAISRVANKGRILILTYTENNQREVDNRFLLRHRGAHNCFTVKVRYSDINGHFHLINLSKGVKT